MKGDVMWYVALKRGLKKTAPEQGIKGFQHSALSNLPRDQSIIMELRVALDETCYKEKSKKYQTRCVSIATSPTGLGISFHTLNRWSRRKRGMPSNPLFIIPDFLLHFPLCYGYLRFEGNGKIPLGR